MENICVPFTDFLSLLFLSPVPYFSRSIKRPGLPRLPRMELVTNGTRFSKMEISKRNFSKCFANGKCPEVTIASLTECAAVQGSKVRFNLQKETVFYLSLGNYLIKPFLHVNHHMQLFRQRLSHRSVKGYATMPIGIMVGIMKEFGVD